jgi:hypothetical protein
MAKELSAFILPDVIAGLGVLLDAASFCREKRFDIADEVLFWLAEGDRAPRLALVGPPGSGLPEVLKLISGAAHTEAELRRAAIELDPDAVAAENLWGDGQRTPASVALANRAHGAAVCPTVVPLRYRVCAVLSATSADGDRLSVDAWLERVALAIVVTPATAALGTVELSLLRKLRCARRPLFLLVSQFAGASPEDEQSFAAEIDQYKIAPCRAELGNLAACMMPLSPATPAKLLAALEPWLAEHLAQAHWRQLQRVGERWFEALLEEAERRAEAEREQRRRLDQLGQHVNILVARLGDVVSTEGLRVQNAIDAAYGRLEEECARSAHAFARWLDDPVGSREALFVDLWRAWEVVHDQVGDALGTAHAQAVKRLNEEISSFQRTYAEILPATVLAIADLQVQSVADALAHWEALDRDSFQEAIDRYTAAAEETYKRLSRPEDGLPPLKPALGDGVSSENLPEPVATDGPGATWRALQTIRDSLERIRGTGTSEYLNVQLSGAMLDALHRYLRPTLLEFTKVYRRDAIPQLAERARAGVDAWRLGTVAAIEERIQAFTAIETQVGLVALHSRWRRCSSHG